MLDKRMTAAGIVAQLSDGMTIGIGGWGPRRKPMALVREILRSDLKDLRRTLMNAWGGYLMASSPTNVVRFAAAASSSG